MFSDFFVHVDQIVIEMMGVAILESLYMMFVSTLFAYVIGLPVGVLLITTAKSGLKPNAPLNVVLNVVVNIMRSVPFLILMIAIIPFTRFVVGTAIGPTATVVPLVVSAAPFVARMVEQSLQEVDGGVVEAAQSMGASDWDIIWKVLLPESRSSLVSGMVIALTTILGYSAIAGVIGGGGLGDMAIRFGYNRYQGDVMWITVILLVLIVQIIQEIGTRMTKRIDKRNIS